MIELNDLKPDRLEMELIKTGDLPLTPLSLERMRHDLGYAVAKAHMLFQLERSKASDPKRLLTQRLGLVKTASQIVTFKVRTERKTTHKHPLLSKNYTGSPTTSVFIPWTVAEVQTHLTTGWGTGAITELKLELLYRSEPEVSRK